MLESIGFRTDKSNVMSKIVPYKRKLPSWLYFLQNKRQFATAAMDAIANLLKEFRVALTLSVLMRSPWVELYAYG